MTQLFSLFATLRSVSSRIKRLSVYWLLGVGMSFLLITSQAQATQTLQLRYGDLKLQIPLADLQAFVADQNIPPALQEFLQTIKQNPADVKQWLTTQIALPQLSERISPDFVVMQLSKVLGDSLGQDNLAFLKVAFERATSGDGSFSILELLQDYPRPDLRLDLSFLERVYTDVSLFVTRIEPVLTTAEARLQEWVCDCDGTGSGLTTQAAMAYAQAREALRALVPSIDLSSASSEAVSPADESARASMRIRESAAAAASRRLVIQYGMFGRSIAISDLTNFAETGELSRGWKFFLSVGGVDPEDIRTGLTQEISVSWRFLDRALNTLPGEFLLYQIGKVLHTPSDRANIQALRAALVFAAANDNRISFLEILQQYPTRQVHIDARQLAKLGSNISKFIERSQIRATAISIRSTVLNIIDWLVQLQASINERFCNCKAP